jgi:hypothetical protein
MRRLALLLSLFAISTSWAATKNDVAPAPLPSVIVNAKTVFLVNNGANLGYDAFYAEMKNWGKYKIVGSPEEADLIIELAYRVEQGGIKIWSSTSSYAGGAQVQSVVVLPQLVLTIYDAKSKNVLWSISDPRKLARLEKNRDKETISSAQRLVEALKVRANVRQ